MLSPTLARMCLLLAASHSYLTTASPTRQASPSDATFNNNTIFQSPPYYTVPGTLYARTAQLPNGNLLATWENYSPEPPPVYFPIFQSTDAGLTWSQLSSVHDQVFGYGLRYQPFLYVLPQAFASWPAGTVLLSGSAIPTNLSSTHIELYASLDSGLTWTFVSHIASGGVALPVDTESPIWEPFLMIYQNQLICFYSDQRDNATYGQKLVHQVSRDGKTWGPVVDDVAYPTYQDRPGMTTVSALPDGKYIMTYEYGNGPVNGSVPANYSFPVYYRISDSPLTFNEAEGLPIVANDGSGLIPFSSPYNVWTETENCQGDGLIIVSCGSESPVFVNKALGDVDSWEVRQTGERVSYTRSLRVLEDARGKKQLLLAGGGPLPPSNNNSVTVGKIDIDWW